MNITLYTDIILLVVKQKNEGQNSSLRRNLTTELIQ